MKLKSFLAFFCLLIVIFICVTCRNEQNADRVELLCVESRLTPQTLDFIFDKKGNYASLFVIIVKDFYNADSLSKECVLLNEQLFEVLESLGRFVSEYHYNLILDCRYDALTSSSICKIRNPSNYDVFAAINLIKSQIAVLKKIIYNDLVYSLYPEIRFYANNILSLEQGGILIKSWRIHWFMMSIQKPLCDRIFEYTEFHGCISSFTTTSTTPDSR